jgi:hypothetical protein
LPPATPAVMHPSHTISADRTSPPFHESRGRPPSHRPDGMILKATQRRSPRGHGPWELAHRSAAGRPPMSCCSKRIARNYRVIARMSARPVRRGGNRGRSPRDHQPPASFSPRSIKSGSRPWADDHQRNSVTGPSRPSTGLANRQRRSGQRRFDSRMSCQAACHPILCRKELDDLNDHPDHPSAPVAIRLDRRAFQRTQPRSFWSRQVRREHPSRNWCALGWACLIASGWGSAGGSD